MNALFQALAFLMLSSTMHCSQARQEEPRLSSQERADFVNVTLNNAMVFAKLEKNTQDAKKLSYFSAAFISYGMFHAYQSTQASSWTSMASNIFNALTIAIAGIITLEHTRKKQNNLPRWYKAKKKLLSDCKNDPNWSLVKQATINYVTQINRLPTDQTITIAQQVRDFIQAIENS